MRFKVRMLLFAGFLLPLPVLSAGPVFPAPFEAEYSLYSKGLKVAHIKRVFRSLEDGSYIYESRSHPVGLLAMFRDDRIVERSHWQQSENGFRPIKYIYKHSGSKKNRDVKIDFDWDKSKVRMQVNDNHWQMDLETGTLDKMLYQLAVMRDLKHGREKFSYRIADGGKMKSYNFEALEHESVETPHGNFEALKVERFRDDRERETIFWCVQELDYLPVKVINIEPDGLQTMALLESYTSLPDTVPSTVTVENRE